MSTNVEDAIDFLTEVCERADAMGITLAKMPVAEVRILIAAVRRRGIQSIDDPQPAELCRRPGGCVCGGDLPRVRAGCSWWKG